MLELILLMTIEENTKKENKMETLEHIALDVNMEIVEIDTDSILLKIYYTIDGMIFGEVQYKTLSKGQILSFESGITAKATLI